MDLVDLVDGVDGNTNGRNEGLDRDVKGIRIVVNDRDGEDSTIELEPDFYGQVELTFRDGCLIQSRESRTKTKEKLRCSRPR